MSDERVVVAPPGITVTYHSRRPRDGSTPHVDTMRGSVEDLRALAKAIAQILPDPFIEGVKRENAALEAEMLAKLDEIHRERKVTKNE